METPTLRYSELTRDAVADFHKRFGGLRVELTPSQGKLLLLMLNQRDRLEKNYLTDPGLFRLLWELIVFRFYGLICHFSYRRLQILEQYVRAVDAAHGNEMSNDGSYVFLLLPIAKRQRVEPSYEVPIQ